MLNKHGYKMVGLKKAVSEMPGENYNGQYVQINYDKRDGEVLANYHVSLGQNSWTEYHDKETILIGNYQAATMQQIADAIAETIAMASLKE